MRDFSPAFEVLVGSTRDEILRNASPALEQFYRQVEKSNEALQHAQELTLRDIELVIRNRDKRWIDLHLMASEWQNRFAILGVAVDVTERKRAEVLQQATYRIADAAYTSTNLEELYPRIHQIICGVMRAQNFYIALYDDATNTISYPYYVDEFDAPPAEPEAPGRSLTAWVLRNGVSLLCDESVQAHLEATGEVELVGTPSPIWLGVPLRARDRIIGVMAVQDYHDALALTPREQQILEFVSSQVALAIQRKQAEDRSRESEARAQARAVEMQALFETTRDLNLAVDLPLLLHTIVERAVLLLRASGGAMYLFDQEHEELSLAVVYNEQLRKYIGTRLKPGEGLAGRIALSRQPMAISDYSRWQQRFSSYEGEAIRAVLGVPMLYQEKLLGVLEVFEYGGGEVARRVYTSSEVDLLTFFASAAANAIENARLIAEIIRRSEQQNILREILLFASQDVALSSLFELTLTKALNLFQVPAGLIWASQPDHPGVYHQAAQGLPPDAHRYLSGFFPSGPVIVKNVARSPTTSFDQVLLAGFLNQVGLQSAVFLPLVSRHISSGGILFGSGQPRSWTQEEIAFLESVANQLIAVLERAHLFAETQMRLIQLENVNAISARVREAQSLEEILPAFLQATLDVVHRKHGAIWLWDEQQGKLRLAAACGDFAAQAGLDYDEGAGPIGSVYRSGDILFLENVALAEHLGLADNTIFPEMSHLLGVPVRTHGHVLGVLVVVAPSSQPFTQNDARLLAILSDMVGSAINRIRLDEQMRRYASELEERVKQRTAELQEAVEQARRANQLKSEFIVNINHELRTPLTNLLLYTRMLQAHPTVKTQERLGVIARELQRLKILIEDLLNFSRLEAGQIEFSLQPTDLNALIASLASDRRLLAEERQLTLMLDLDEHLPPLPLDQALMLQVISNLLTNALNYTPAGGQVSIRTWWRQRNGKDWAVLSVEDNGPGIPPEERPYLFQRFFRGRAARQTGVAGTGLGLSIVKQIVELHGGTIEVPLPPAGKGAIFQVWLPMGERTG